MNPTGWHHRFSDTLLSGSPAKSSRSARLASPETMVLACSESCLNAALSVFATGQALIWRTPGNVVPSDPMSGRGPLAFALRCGFRNLVVLGHSRCGWVEQQESDARPARRREGMDRMVWRIQQAQRVKVRAMNNIVEQMEALRDSPDVAEAIHTGRLSLHGWFYLDETGLFMKYDDRRQCFEPSTLDS